MAASEELRLTLARLLEDRPGAVTSYPDLDGSDGGPPPYPIRLAPWAEAVAAELHGRFGDQVDLTAGPGAPPGAAFRRARRPARPGRGRGRTGRAGRGPVRAYAAARAAGPQLRRRRSGDRDQRRGH